MCDVFHLVNALGNSLSLAETLADLDTQLRKLIAFESLAVSLPLENGLAPAYLSGAEARFRSVLEIPIPLDHGEGMLSVYHRRPGAFDEHDREVLRAIRSKVTAAIANAVRFERVERLAAVDPESNLLNERALFLRLDSELARARRTGATVGVVVGNLGARPVDWPALAAALRPLFREDDGVARMGETFVLVLAGMAPVHLPEKQTRIETVLAQHGVPAELGAAFYPDDGVDADGLLALAGQRRGRLVP